MTTLMREDYQEPDRSLGISKKSGAEIVTCVGETNLGSRAVRGNTADRAKAACESDRRGEG